MTSDIPSAEGRTAPEIAPSADPGSVPVHQYDEFINGMAQYLANRGFPRAAGRIFAVLLVCEPPEQTAAQLAEAIGSSRGTISSMTHLLMRMGLIDRLAVRGAREAVYRTSPGTIDTVVTGGIEPVRRARELTARGLALMSDRPAASRARLQELHDAYRFFELTLPALLERWAREHPQEQQ